MWDIYGFNLALEWGENWHVQPTVGINSLELTSFWLHEPLEEIQFTMFRVDYVYYKANKCADILAKLDALQVPTFVWNYAKDTTFGTILYYNLLHGDTFLLITTRYVASCDTK